MSSIWSDRKPGQTLELMPNVDIDRLAETLVAFANAEGGVVVFGLDTEGRVNGSLGQEEIEDALGRALSACRPAVATEWRPGEVKGSSLVTIYVPRSKRLHTLEGGQVMVRSGAENRPLGGDGIARLATSKSSVDFEREPVRGAQFDDLDPTIIAEYRAKRSQKQPSLLNVDDRTMLVRAGALTREGTPTVAGLLLFGFAPQDLLPQSRLNVIHFEGDSMRGPGGQTGYLRYEKIAGPLPRLIEESWKAITEEMRMAAVVKGLVREDKTEYPKGSVREALVNAVCHRDYQDTGRHIEVRMFDDRMEIISPGGLPGHVTIDNIVEEHFSRNPRLVDGLFQWGFIEELGLGVDRMIEEMTKNGHPPPVFADTGNTFSVTLKNARIRRVMHEWETNMNERQLQALSYIQEHGRITNREYRNLCPNVSTETLRLDLADLVQRGLLLKLGAKRGTSYILKKPPGG